MEPEQKNIEEEFRWAGFLSTLRKGGENAPKNINLLLKQPICHPSTQSMRTITIVPLRMLVHLLLLLLVLVDIAVIQAVPVQLYGLNYNTRKGADWNPLKCKSREEVVRELQLLSRLTSRFRILSLTDCGQGELVLEVVRELGLKVWLGLWVSDDETVFYRELAGLEDFLDRGLIDDTVLGISVGSESIYREEVTANEIIGFKDEVKELLVANNMADVLVSICDIAPTFQYNYNLVSNSDIVITNAFPFWEGININSAIDHLETQINPIINFAATENKEVILGETGWPSAGYIPGVGIAGPALQAQYFRDFYCRMDQELNWAYYYFTGIDDKWRQEQDKNNTIEGNWGFLYANLTLKSDFEDLSFSCPNNPSVVYTFSEIDWTVPVVVAPPTVSPAPISATNCQAHSSCRAAGLFGNCCPGDNGQYLACCASNTIGGTMTSPTTSPITATFGTDLPTALPRSILAPTRSPLATGSSSTTFPTTVPVATRQPPSTTRPAAAPSMPPTTVSPSIHTNNTEPISMAPSNSAAPATGSSSTSGPTAAPAEVAAASVSPSMIPTSPTAFPFNNNTTEPTSEAPTTPTGLPTTSSVAPSSVPTTALTLEQAATSIPQPTSSSSMTGANALMVHSLMILAPLLQLALM